MQVVVDGESHLGHLPEQIATAEACLPEVGQGIVEAARRLLVLCLYLGTEFDGLGQNLAQLVGEIPGTAHHTVLEVGLVQALVRHRLDDLLPFAGYVEDALAQVHQGLVVQLFQGGMTVVEELSEDAHHGLLQGKDGAEIEELQQQVALVFLFEQGQLTDAALSLVLLLGNVRVDPFVVDDGTRLQGRCQQQTFEGAAAAQGHIHLTGCETLVGIDDGVVEGQSLTLMDGDGPGQSQGQLPEGALHLGLNLACLLVQRVAGVLPFQRFHLDGLAVALAIDGETVVAGLHHTSDATIIIPVVARGVVLYEHHLCALLQDQCLGCGIGVFRERALDFCAVGIGRRGQFPQLRLIIVVGDIIVSGQSDVTTPLPRREGLGGESAVQLCQHRFRRMAVAYLI